MKKTTTKLVQANLRALDLYNTVAARHAASKGEPPMESPKQPTIPGLPGKPPLAIARSEALDAAFIKLYQALVPLIESLPATADSVLTIRRMIRGDEVKVSFKPGKEE